MTQFKVSRWQNYRAINRRNFSFLAFKYRVSSMYNRGPYLPYPTILLYLTYLTLPYYSTLPKIDENNFGSSKMRDDCDAIIFPILR